MLKFGTSGLRGLVEELTDKECYLYTIAFLEYLQDLKLVKKNCTVSIAGDFRPSTPRILKACVAAIKDFGFQIDYCGIIPTPTVSFYAFQRKIPSIMVTGSHIPYDRNGIKFNLPTAEILKKDEQIITAKHQKIANNEKFNQLFDKKGTLKKNISLPKLNKKAETEYIERYLKFFPKNLLKGKRIVVFQHSAVIRDIMASALKKLGAVVIKVERSEKFIPIDTEAIQEIYLKKAQTWVKKYKADAILSADGDSDRPMLFDETGTFIRGDFLGVITSAYLKADSVSATASCTTALEKSKLFRKINRTKIGSPYVVEAMQNDEKKGFRRVGSYEANGGYLLQTNLKLNGCELRALPTRDSMLPILSALALAKKKNLPLSKLVRLFPQRFVYSQSIKGFPTEKGQEILKKISAGDLTAKKTAQKIFGLVSEIEEINFLDGARMFLSSGEILHVRPSGNSPELRVYCETGSLEKSKKMTEEVLNKLAEMKK
ncbi:MAG TPA: phosphomannomutase [Candidatus Moranbacteria bacterium]|nr:phosphomannomutase [Candidatus Moranbacteria bacterium]